NWARPVTRSLGDSAGERRDSRRLPRRLKLTRLDCPGGPQTAFGGQLFSNAKAVPNRLGSCRFFLDPASKNRVCTPQMAWTLSTRRQLLSHARHDLRK